MGLVEQPPPGAEQPIYDRLWAEAAERYAAGAPQLDPFLLRQAADRRRGLTLVARPAGEPATRIAELVGELREHEPEQYFYQADELHLTVMSLVSAVESFDLARAPIAAYQAALGELFAQSRRFCIRFRGVTASPGAVLIQGYADGDALNQLREAIRHQIARAGLAGGLDVRYRIATAHITIMRFRTPPRDLPRLLARLRAARERDFGSMVIEQIDFVANDWYMVRDRVQLLDSYRLQ